MGPYTNRISVPLSIDFVRELLFKVAPSDSSEWASTGGQYGRPHYHAAVFGVAPEDAESITASWHGLRDVDHGSRPGFCHHGELNPASAAYLAGYVTKKLTKSGDPTKLAGLAGREPEFALMSRNPGIGKLGIQALIEAMNSSAGALYIARNGDVPNAFLAGGRMLPIGRLIRDELRLYFFGETGQPRAAKELAERRFNAELPAMPLDASPVVRARVLAAFPEAAAKAHAAYFSKLEVRGRQTRRRHEIHSSKRTL